MADDTVKEKAYFLTVAEGKRLIAKAVAKHPDVQRALREGIVAVAKGTTNAYVVEELLGTPINKLHYCTGTSQPRKGAPRVEVSGKIPDLVLKKGERVEGVTATTVIEQMRAGDVYIKGANALNYREKTAGVLIGHPTGGTVGSMLGPVIARRITLLIPVGLEKEVPWRIADAAQQLLTVDRHGQPPTLWPLQGTIVTELEAIQHLTGARAIPIAAGGINGGEGGVWLAVFGSAEAMESVEGLMASLAGEPPFVPVTLPVQQAR
jgi:hypothetical protein